MRSPSCAPSEGVLDEVEVDLDGFASDEAYVRLLVGQEDTALALLRTFLHNNWSQRGYIERTPWFVRFKAILSSSR